MNRVAKIAIALLLLVAGSAALNLDSQAEAGRRCRRGGCGSGCYSSCNTGYCGSSCSTGACEVAMPAPPPAPPAPVCSSCGPAGCDTGYCNYGYSRCGRGRRCCR